MLNVAIAVDSATDFGPQAVQVVAAACEEVIGEHDASLDPARAMSQIVRERVNGRGSAGRAAALDACDVRALPLRMTALAARKIKFAG